MWFTLIQKLFRKTQNTMCKYETLTLQRTNLSAKIELPTNLTNKKITKQQIKDYKIKYFNTY